MRIFKKSNKKSPHQKKSPLGINDSNSGRVQPPMRAVVTFTAELDALERLLDKYSKSREILKHLALFESKLFHYQAFNRTHEKQRTLADIEPRIVIPATKQLGNLIDKSDAVLWTLLERMRGACQISNIPVHKKKTDGQAAEEGALDPKTKLEQMLDEAFEQNISHADFEATVPFASLGWEDTRPM